MSSRIVRVEKTRGPITWHEYALNGERAPGVTSVLGAAVAKPGLLGWYAQQGAMWARDHEDLASMDEETFMAQARKAPDLRRDAKARTGTTLHEYAALLGSGQEVEPDSELAGRVELIADFLNRYRVKVLASEAVVFHEDLGYAGTLDVIADLWVDGGWQRWLLDYKTGSGIYAEVVMQLAAYRYASHAQVAGIDRPMAQVQRCGVVHVQSNDWQLVPVNAGPEAFAGFRNALALYRWLKLPKDQQVGMPLPHPDLEGAEQ